MQTPDTDTQSELETQITAGMQVLLAVQYSPPLHVVPARQVPGVWQVRGPPLASSLQIECPGTVEQSDDAAHSTNIVVGNKATNIDTNHIDTDSLHRRTVPGCRSVCRCLLSGRS